MAATVLAFGLASCGSSSNYNNAGTPGLRLAKLPTVVHVEAKKATPIPAGPLNGKKSEELILQLSKSETDKIAALNSGITAHEKQRRYIANRGKKTKAKASAGFNPFALFGGK